MANKLLRFGVNYVPSGTWWHAWMDWQPAKVQADLEQIAALGMDHIRVHCLWHLFQPNPNRVSSTALKQLKQLLELADACDLDVQVTVLNGWLSGFAFYPAWKTPIPDALGLNLFTDSGMIAAEQLLFSEIANCIGQHPRFLGFDLGNEINVLQYGDDRVSLPEADAWQQTMFVHCQTIAPNKLHVNGVDHQPWFASRGFSRNALATLGSATAIHMWVEFTGALQRYGATGVGSLHLAEYGIELAKAHHLELNRSVWLQEFGASQQWMPSHTIPNFAEQTIFNAASCQNLWGITWWCSHDLDPGLTGFHPLEYDLGLFDSKNRAKPVAIAIQNLIQNFQIKPLERHTALLLPDKALHNSSSAWAFATRFFDLIEDGLRPAILLESQMHTAASQGITEVIV